MVVFSSFRELALAKEEFAKLGLPETALHLLSTHPDLLVRLHADYRNGQLYDGELNALGEQLYNLVKYADEPESDIQYKLQRVFRNADKHLRKGRPISAINHLISSTVDSESLNRASRGVSRFFSRRATATPVAQTMKRDLIPVLDFFKQIGMQRYGFLQLHPKLLIGLHELYNAGAIEKKELLHLGNNFVNLVTDQPHAEREKVFKKFGKIFKVAAAKLKIGDGSTAIAYLLNSTNTPDSLNHAAKFAPAEQLRSTSLGNTAIQRIALLSYKAKKLANQFVAEAKVPDKERSEQAYSALQSINFPRHGMLRAYPRLLISLHEYTTLHFPQKPVELRELGNNLTVLTSNHEAVQQNQPLLSKLFAKIEHSAKHLTPDQVVTRLRLTTQSPQHLQRATRDTSLSRFKETAVGKALFTELQLPKRQIRSTTAMAIVKKR